MTCRACGLGEPVPVSDEPGSGSRFTETWECPSCGATGGVSGDTEKPVSEWSRNGMCFDTDFDGGEL